VSGTAVYAGGDFTTIGGTPRSYLAAIDTGGTCLTSYSSSCLLSWNPNASNAVQALAVSGSTVYAGGAFTTISVTPRNRLAAVGTDGSLQSWNPDAGGFSPTVYALAVSGSTVYAGGDFTSIGGTPRSYLAAIGTDGSLQSWNPNASSIVFTLAVSGTTVYVGGDFTTISGTARNRLAAIGTDGSLQSWDPNANFPVYALAVSDTTVYVGGYFTQIGCNTGCSITGGPFIRNRLAAITTGGTLQSWNPDAGAVEALAVSGSTVYAGGSFTSIGGTGRNRLAAIDTGGTCLTSYSSSCLLSWNPNASNAVQALAVSSSTVYAGGSFTSIGGTGRNRLAAIGTDGSLQSWNPNANNLVNAIAVSGPTVYAGGQFTSIGGIPRNRIVSINADGSVNW
jgi:WD40 repeat protein